MLRLEHCCHAVNHELSRIACLKALPGKICLFYRVRLNMQVILRCWMNHLQISKSVA